MEPGAHGDILLLVEDADGSLAVLEVRGDTANIPVRTTLLSFAESDPLRALLEVVWKIPAGICRRWRGEPSRGGSWHQMDIGCGTLGCC